MCSIPRIDYGKALLGEFADDWHFVTIFPDNANDGLGTGFRNWTTDHLTALDSRIHWADLAVDEDDPRVLLAI